jgi:hypothetical protein
MESRPSVGNASNGNGRPPKPAALPVVFDHIPMQLRQGRRFVLWRYTWRNDRWTKPPYQPNGDPASSTDPETWTTFEEVEAEYRSGGWDGIGRIHLPEDNLVGADADHVRDAASGEITGDAAGAVLSLNTYTETSPSGDGLRAFAHGRKPGPTCKRGGFELYDGLTRNGEPGGRYLTLTGHHLPGTPAEVCDRQPEVEAAYRKMFGGNGSGESGRKATTSKPTASKTAIGDEEIIDRARAAKNGIKFARLWSGDRSGYPSDSEADLALCDYIAFWTGPDPCRIDALFRQSGLMREKWERTDYRDRTIRKAIESRTEFFSWRAATTDGEPVAPGPSDSPAAAAGAQMAWEIIRDYWLGMLHPTFKRPGAIHSDRTGRELKRRELLEGAPPDLIDLLVGAANAPCHKGTQTVNIEALPRFFSTWAPTAWAAVMRLLPEEVATAVVSESAAEQFRSWLRAALLKLVAVGTVHKRGKDEEYTTVERRPLMHWAEIFARANRAKAVKGWADVRGHSIWARYDGDVLRVALHHDLFAQIHAFGMPDTTRRFTDLARLYDVAAPGDGPKVKRGSLRLLELSAAFIEDLLPVPEELAGDWGTRVFSRAQRENSQSPSPSEGKTS